MSSQQTVYNPLEGFRCAYHMDLPAYLNASNRYNYTSTPNGLTNGDGPLVRESYVKDIKKTIDYENNVDANQYAVPNGPSAHWAHYPFHVTTTRPLEDKDKIPDIANLESLLNNLSTEFDKRAVDLSKDDGIFRNQSSSISSLSSSVQESILGTKANWSWIANMVKCMDVHLYNAAAYHQFNNEIQEYENNLHDKLTKLAQVFDKEELEDDRKSANKIIAELKDAHTVYLTWRERGYHMMERCRDLVPVNKRTEPVEAPLPVKALCNYKTKDLEIREGEDLILLDNKDPNTWKVKNADGKETTAPALIFLIPPPDSVAVDKVMKLRTQLLGYWTVSNKVLGKTTIWFMCLVFREWSDDEIQMLKSMPVSKKQEILRILQLIENTLGVHWYKYSGYIELQDRIHNLRKIIRDSLDYEGKDDAATSRVVIQVETLEKLLQAYQNFWNDWEAYKILVEITRHPKYMLVCDKWDQLNFASTAYILKYWHTEFSDRDLGERDETDTFSETSSVTSRTYRMQDVQVRRESTTAETSQYTSAEREESTKFVIRAVMDPRTDEEISMKDAVKRGIINPKLGMYINRKTGEKMPIPMAMTQGLILVEAKKTEKTAEKKQSLGILKLTIRRETKPYTVMGVIDYRNDEELTIDEAIDAGIYDEENGYYINPETKEKIALADAIDLGLLTVEFDELDESESEVITNTYAISAVVDKKKKTRVTFQDAITSGLIDKEEGVYYDTETMEKIELSDALKKGYLKATLVQDPDTALTPGSKGETFDFSKK
ncbi:unnamed protein product [Owenia fusiformis]|uniref:SH3 domain-containing protein n=1 Tax=Owenia fusiformis TaxID=6347 RepID=A0A8S4NKD2_OWEFU|nr:unnamed protein product [Owenia fusiformis]